MPWSTSPPCGCLAPACMDLPCAFPAAYAWIALWGLPAQQWAGIDGPPLGEQFGVRGAGCFVWVQPSCCRLLASPPPPGPLVCCATGSPPFAATRMDILEGRAPGPPLAAGQAWSAGATRLRGGRPSVMSGRGGCTTLAAGHGQGEGSQPGPLRCPPTLVRRSGPRSAFSSGWQVLGGCYCHRRAGLAASHATS